MIMGREGGRILLNLLKYVVGGVSVLLLINFAPILSHVSAKVFTTDMVFHTGLLFHTAASSGWEIS